MSSLPKWSFMLDAINISINVCVSINEHGLLLHKENSRPATGCAMYDRKENKTINGEDSRIDGYCVGRKMVHVMCLWAECDSVGG